MERGRVGGRPRLDWSIDSSRSMRRRPNTHSEPRSRGQGSGSPRDRPPSLLDLLDQPGLFVMPSRNGYGIFTFTKELAEIVELKAKVRRLEDDHDILRRAMASSWGRSTPEPLIVAFIDECRQAGHAVEFGRSQAKALPGPVRAGPPGRRTDLPSLGHDQAVRS